MEYISALCRGCWKDYPYEEIIKISHPWRTVAYCCHPCYEKETVRCPFCKRIYIPFQWERGETVCWRCRILEENAFPPAIKRREYKRVHENVRRAISRNLPATLTLEQWLATLMHFKEICAYCLERPYENMDHFIPLRQGGGTTSQNCIPACKACNDAKGHRHPSIVTTVPTEALDRVSRYLSHL